MTSEFPPTVAELIETFEDLEDWEERYEYILDLGRELPPFPDPLRTEVNKVQGCMSTVWMVVNGATAAGSHRPHIQILADSDSVIVKGLIAILLSLFSGKTPVDVINNDATNLFGKLGLTQHLSPNRRNGLFAMVNRIREQSVQIEADFSGNGREHVSP